MMSRFSRKNSSSGLADGQKSPRPTEGGRRSRVGSISAASDGGGGGSGGAESADGASSNGSHSSKFHFGLPFINGGSGSSGVNGNGNGNGWTKAHGSSKSSSRLSWSSSNLNPSLATIPGESVVSAATPTSSPPAPTAPTASTAFTSHPPTPNSTVATTSPPPEGLVRRGTRGAAKPSYTMREEATVHVSSTPDENRRKLRMLVQKVKWATRDGELEEAFEAFEAVAGNCRALCDTIVAFEVRKRTTPAAGQGAGGRGPAGGPQLGEDMIRILEKAPGLMEVREWRETVSALTTRLAERVSSGVVEADDEGKKPPTSLDRDDNDVQEVYLQQQISVKEELSHITRLLEFPEANTAPDPISHECDIARRGDTILEFPVLPDNSSVSPPSPPSDPAAPFQTSSFRVSSHFLAETSPLFAQLFSNAPIAPRNRDASVIGLNPRPRIAVTSEGAQVKVYRMAPLKASEVRPLEILLHAAHMHNDKIPRRIDFPRFVAIAELCSRFQCTSPLELFVELRWLPDWLHMGVEAMPDGLLLISYVFGIRRLFTRMSKSAILNLVDEVELEGKRWPRELKERVWAVRGAKMEQIYACCIGAVQEYLRPPSQPIDAVVNPPAATTGGVGRRTSIFEDHSVSLAATMAQSLQGQGQGQGAVPSSSVSMSNRVFPTSMPRCPKGSHECDAANLGFFMIVLAELQLLPIIMNPHALAHMAPSSSSPEGAGLSPLAPPKRSLAQLVRILQGLPSPPNPVHRGGVCDPVPAFRAAVIDIYNSLSGLTLYDVTGMHGYGLSRHHAETPQKVLRPVTTGDVVGMQQQLKRVANAVDDAVGVVGADADADADADLGAVGVPEAVALRILREVGSAQDMKAAAMISRSFYDTYKSHESALLSRVDDGEGAARMKGKEKEGEEALGSRLDGAMKKTWSDVLGARSPSPSYEMLTEEEARQVLWPDSPPKETTSFMVNNVARRIEVSTPREPLPAMLQLDGASAAATGLAPEGAREKFRAGDLLFAEAEEKMLCVVETKQLTAEHDSYLGMHKDKVEVQTWV